MSIFGRTPTVDGKARTVLGDLPEDPSPFEILQTVDQKAGDDVDPDEVVSKMRALDESVDQKLASIEGDDVDQKEMRMVARAIADRTKFSESAAMDLLSAAVEAADRMDPMHFVDEFDARAADEQLDGAEIDQRAQTNDDTPDMDDNTPDDPDVDQKQENEEMSPLGLVEEVGGSDARDTVENYADSVNKDAEECAADWIAENVPGVTVEGHGGTTGDGGSNAPEGGGVDTAGNDPDDDPYDDVDQMLEEKVDQKLGDLNINERVADAVTADGVLSEMAGAVAQKLTEDEELADQLVETVDQKGDFATTDDTVVPAPGDGSQTVGEAGAVTGGDDA